MKNLEQKKTFPSGFKAVARQTSSTQKAQLMSSLEKQQFDGNDCLQGCSFWTRLALLRSGNLVRW